MLFSECINIALCFNSEAEAQNLSLKLKEISPHISFITAPNFSDFLKAITHAPKIDCFIIEEKYRDCLAVEMINQLKRDQKYKKSVISVFSPDIKKIDSKFYELGTDYIFDMSFELRDVVANLKKLILKNIEPVIPKNYNVMVLDNSPEILDVITHYLHELGHDKVDLCKDIKGAKQKLQINDYDLLLLDWNLDDGTCLDIIEFIKSKPVSTRTKAAVTIVITGRNDVEDIMTLLRYGIKDHIIKPFEFQEFVDKISYALEKSSKGV